MMKPICLKDNTYIDSAALHSNKDPKFKVGDHARSSKYKIIFAKRYTPNFSEGIFVIKNVKKTVPWTYAINDLKGEKIIVKEPQMSNQQKFKIEKVVKKKGDKLYIKWKGYDS